MPRLRTTPITYQVFQDATHLRKDTRMEYRVVVRDESGRVRTASG